MHVDIFPREIHEQETYEEVVEWPTKDEQE
jgi:hypothetical protein